MDIGTGIAIAGVWMFVGMCWHTKHISGHGMLLSLIVGLVTTIFLT